ncbi:NADPH:quinone oxidoreductase [Marmoricola endophyticus]|uniref:NADPH:quinone oxidoreductase n=1 Tax=Marmoricola endophyticus TaxID=2040280 RepID=A0A917F2Z0_9ACTN|nr:NADPH:quinone oxidoreductase family protein [Marmoricola endophyticus]GGF47635.1 NADPH:quinone oxidoreductase [Marmoricola endophyticus]
MRAAMVSSLDGPDAVEVVDVPEPTAGEGQVLVDVQTVGIAWPDLLLSKGEYQVRPELPFALGVDAAGTVREASGEYAAGDRVAVVQSHGSGCEVLAAPSEAVFPLPDEVSFEQAAGIGMNYLTAHFALAVRGSLAEGETVLVTGAAGGLGTALLQVAKGLGARTVGLVSTAEKAEVARTAGADATVVLEELDGRLKDAVVQAAGGPVDIVADVVGGQLFTDYLRCLGEEGRLLVLGFTGGSIPEVKVNRLLLNNVDVRGVGWGAYAMSRRGYMRWQWDALVPMMRAGTVDPPLGPVRPVEEIGAALVEMAERKVLGKTVLRF